MDYKSQFSGLEIEERFISVENKVDSIQGKGLSTNDYTNEDKTLVGTISNKMTNPDDGSVGQVLTKTEIGYEWKDVSVGSGGTTDFELLNNRPKYNGDIMNKDTNIPKVPTKTSDLTNDSSFLTEHQSLSAYRTSSAQDVIDITKADASAVAAINKMIPQQATPYNQLADKDFVNSSIQTNTATFKGSYDATNNGWTKIIRRGQIVEGEVESSLNWNHSNIIENFNIGQITWVSSGIQNVTVTINKADGSGVLFSYHFELEEEEEEIHKTVEFNWVYRSYTVNAKIYYCNDGVSEDWYEIYIKGDAYKNIINDSAHNLPDGINMEALTLDTADNNDYMFFSITDDDSNTQYQRYKYVYDEEEEYGSWEFEYNLNTTGFTVVQWNAVNSGATASNIAAIAGKYTKPSEGIPETDLADAAKKVRTAIYETTTFATMKEWLDNSDVVRCVMGDNNDMIGYVTYYSENKIHFLASSLDNGVSGDIGICVVANGQGESDIWSYGTFQPEIQGNRVDTIGSAPSSSKYPSESCLANALENKADVVSQIDVANTTASQELAPNTLYVFATRSSNLTLSFGSAISGIANEYNFKITIDSTTLPTISGLSSVTWNGGSAPSFALGKVYEVSIAPIGNNYIGVFIEI